MKFAVFYRILLFGAIALLLADFEGFFDDSPVAADPTCFNLTQRDRYCIYEDVCVNQRYGVFVLGRKPSSPVPAVNMRAADVDNDHWVTPPFVSRTYAFQATQPLWINRTLLYGHGMWLNHMTHRLASGLLPAIDVYRHVKLGSLAPGSLPPEFDLILKHERPENLQEPLHWDFREVFLGNPRYYHLLNDQQRTVCYPRAIWGLNNTCPFGTDQLYCDHGHDKELYDHVKELVWEHCQLTAPGPAAQRNESALQILVIQRERTRRMFQIEGLVQVLEKYGQVRVLELEGMSFCEQAREFYETDVVVAAHGNAMGHLLWMREDTALIELSAYGFESHFFRNLLKGTKSRMLYHSLKCKHLSCAVEGELKKGLAARDLSLVMDSGLLGLVDKCLSQVSKEL